MYEYSLEIRNLIKHENELVNHRLGWLLTTQSLLYVALGLVWKQGVGSVIIIAVVGILSCLSFGYSLRFADKAIAQISAAYHEKLRKEGKKETDYPPIIGYQGDDTILSLLPWNFLPWLHIAAWSLLIILRSFGAKS